MIAPAPALPRYPPAMMQPATQPVRPAARRHTRRVAIIGTLLGTVALCSPLLLSMAIAASILPRHDKPRYTPPSGVRPAPAAQPAAPADAAAPASPAGTPAETPAPDAAAAPVVTPTSAAASPAGDPAQGLALYERHACIDCHSNDPEVELPGPTFVGYFGSAVALADGSTVSADAGHIRQSILRPGDRVTQGYFNSMASYAGQLTDDDIAHLTAYIATLAAAAE